VSQTNRFPSTILIVDDSQDIRDMLKVVVEALGYSTLEATHGREALEIAKQCMPDLILMDLSMPVMDGFGATRIIREQPDIGQVPIVAVSAHNTPRYRMEALQVGCNEYLSKPVNFAELSKLITRLLSGSAGFATEAA
jgi:two-component system, cell cycle response regulator DivK